jgi:hypothetical protein
VTTALSVRILLKKDTAALLLPYGRDDPPCGIPSDVSSPDRRPALFLEFRPSCPFVSRRTRFTGRTVDAVIVRSLAVLGVGGFVAGCGFFAADNDGEGVDEVPPFVWAPEGAARFTLIELFCCNPLGTTGAIVPAKGHSRAKATVRLYQIVSIRLRDYALDQGGAGHR